MLAVLISRAKEVEQIKEVVPHLIDEGLSVLQYADDTIIFMDNDLERAKKYEAPALCFGTIIRAQDQLP
jgi:hypothetical protein